MMPPRPFVSSIVGPPVGDGDGDGVGVGEGSIFERGLVREGLESSIVGGNGEVEVLALTLDRYRSFVDSGERASQPSH